MRRLQALRHGVAALVMPVETGWRVQYPSQPTFDSESGTDFPSFTDAVDAIAAVLPAVNTPEERARAQEELDDYLRRVSERSAPDSHTA